MTSDVKNNSKQKKEAVVESATGRPKLTSCCPHRPIGHRLCSEFFYDVLQRLVVERIHLQCLKKVSRDAERIPSHCVASAYSSLVNSSTLCDKVPTMAQ